MLFFTTEITEFFTETRLSNLRVLRGKNDGGRKGNLIPVTVYTATLGRKLLSESPTIVGVSLSGQLFALHSLAAAHPLQVSARAGSDFGAVSALAAFWYESLR